MDIPEDYSPHDQHCTTRVLEGVRFLEGLGPLENTSVSSVPKLHAPALNVLLNFEGLPRHGHINLNVIRPANFFELLGSTFLDLQKHSFRMCMNEMITSRREWKQHVHGNLKVKKS